MNNTVQKKLDLKVTNMAFECGQSYYIVKYGTESFKVKMYDFQKRERLPQRITCTCVGKDRRGRYIFEQDLKDVLYQLYEEECEYTFLAAGLITAGKEPYLLLKDDYGFNHKLYNLNYDAYLNIGKTITCQVESITEKGELVLSCEDLQPMNRPALASKIDLDLFDTLRNFRLKASEIFQDPDYINVWRGIIDKYPDSAHFIYEFLQNADDALATEVTIILQKNGLSFKHNGKEHFTVSEKTAKGKDLGHINSITAIGNSTKTDNKIGKFGVGFKSVFTYTDEPEIYDDYFRFRIENYMVPNLIENDHPFRKEGETLFFIPFKNPDKAYREIKKKLESLDNPILFLRNLKKITWFEISTPDDIHVYTKTITEQISHGTIKGEFIVLNNCSQQCKLWLFTRPIEIKGNGTHNISIGYYINDKGDIDTARRPYVYCFFPTKEKFGVCMIAHAPFELVDSRQNVKNDSAINSNLSNSLAILAADSLEVLRKIGIDSGHLLINDNLFDIVPVEYDYDNDGIIDRNNFYQAFINKLKNGNFFLTREGKYVGVHNALLPNPINLADFISDSQLTELCLSNKAFIASNITTRDEAWTYLTDELEVEEFSSEVLASSISKRPVFMPKQEDAWLHRLYAFLKEDAIKLWRPNPMFKKLQNLPFRSCPIIKTTKGTFVPPYKGEVLNVFLASISTDETLNIVNPALLENNTTRQFFNELGIKEVDESVYIEKRIAKYTDRREIRINQNVEDIEQFYIYAQKLPHDKRKPFIQKLREHLTIQCKQNNNVIFSTLSDVYSDKWVETFFKGCSDVKLMAIAAYDSLFEKYGKDQILEFLYEIGLRENPHPRTEQLLGYDAYAIPRTLNEKQRAKIFFPDLRPTYGITLTDFVIDGFKNAVANNLTLEMSKNIWSWLCDCSLEFDELVCRYKYTNDSRQFRADSTILIQLKTSKWLYGKDGCAHLSTDLKWYELEELGYIYNKKLIDLLSIQVSILESLEEISDEDKAIYRRGKKYSDLSPEEEAQLDLFYQSLKKKRKKEKQKEERDFLSEHNEDLRSTGDDSFVSTSEFSKTTKKTSTTKPTAEERAEKLKDAQEKVLNELNRNEELEVLRESVQDMEKYSKEWFESLLELEYKNDTPIQNRGTSKAISLTFGKVMPDPVSERIYILKNPSGTIPMEIETIERLEVHFEFMDRDDMNIVFEVASVRDFTLRIKAKASDSSTLSKIDWKKCTRATVSANNPTELMGKLITAFNALGVAEGFNFKQNLGDNISFVFGPPGTGKTTYLANQICDIINSEDYCKILVLTPTNKACDVITEKIADLASEPSWLGRFVATGSDRIENSDLLCGRDSEIDEHDKCCLVSTIARLPYDGFQRLGGAPRLRDIDWNYVIIDEASMIPLAQIVYAIYQFSPYAKIIIAGDPMQIPPICQEEIWKDENIYTMVNLNRFDNPVTEPKQFQITNLSTQYRSLPAIGNIFSEYAYNGKLTHHRQASDIKEVNIGGLPLKPINFIQFKVDKYDNIYGPKKLSGSNVQIYSVLLINEICRYVSERYNEDRKLNIGIICPYVAESQMIERLIEQMHEIPENISFSVGTIHGFQGDECDMVFVVFNPPKGITTHPDKIMLNKQHIINVAVSRARDYLFLLIPHKDTVGYENLVEINKIGRIIIDNCKGEYQYFTSDQIEKLIFGQSKYLEENTFVTSHQMANVYTEAGMKYEVRIDDNSVDVQISEID